MRVVVDAMGSDSAPGPEVAGALRAVRGDAIDSALPSGVLAIRVTLVGDEARLRAELAAAGGSDADAIEIVHASEVVTMHDHPGQAFRSKPDSSMRVAVARVAAGQGDAVVSAGNSGAMLACAVLVIGRLPGIERPAIVTVLPTPTGPLVMCDSGANTEPRPSQLAQFGILAAAYDRVVHGREHPRLGLLSNGSEPGKGTPLTRAAHDLLAATPNLNYVGYVEGSDLFRDVVDAIATDGFTGNIVLKTCEGIAEGMFGLVRQELAQAPLAQLVDASRASSPAIDPIARALRGLAKRIDYTEIGGALLAGVAQPTVIAHGRSDGNAIANAIRAAARFAAQNLPEALAASIG